MAFQTWRRLCLALGTPSAYSEASSGGRDARLGEFTHHTVRAGWPAIQSGGCQMKWTKPEAEVVAVTMEVTAYVATL
jgi:hypothetical protein